MFEWCTTGTFRFIDMQVPDDFSDKNAKNPFKDPLRLAVSDFTPDEVSGLIVQQHPNVNRTADVTVDRCFAFARYQKRDLLRRALVIVFDKHRDVFADVLNEDAPPKDTADNAIMKTLSEELPLHFGRGSRELVGCIANNEGKKGESDLQIFHRSCARQF